MTFQAQIYVPGMIKVSYPYKGQTVSSFVKIAGSVAAVSPDKLPSGIGYIQNQLPDNLKDDVIKSFELNGKRYFIKSLIYYCDGTAVREVSYVNDEISSYQFTDDYIGVVYGDTLAPGDHKFTIFATFFSPQNPAIDIYDVMDIPFTFFDNSSNSVLPYLNTIAPQQFVGGIDYQIFHKMFDFILTQRTEGALKNDIDALETLYDLDNVPQQLIPYLAKTIGYDYFAGLLGNDDTIRDELKFLPEWQKSVGTKESILVLLRALSLDGEINPLYLDLTNKVLVPGVKLRYQYEDVIKVVAQTKRARFTFPLTQSTFIDNTIRMSITGLDGTVYATLLWDIAKNAAHWTSFDTTDHWLVKSDGSQATLADVAQVYADQARGGITVVFTSAVKTLVSLEVTVDYQYEVDSRPGRNTRLSEFFNVKINTLAKPNLFPAKDYDHIIDIIKRSKPLRTKMESIDLPVLSADAYVVNYMSVSSTGSLSKMDRLVQYNIKSTEANVRNPIVESVDIRLANTLLDGFLFSWEGCAIDDNRFSIQASLAIDPELLTDETKQTLLNDNLSQRNFALLVNDDTPYKTLADKTRYLRRIDLRIDNTKPCVLLNNILIHGETLRYDTPQSPAIQSKTELLGQLDGTQVFLNVDLMNHPVNRIGYSVRWNLGESTFTLWDLFVNASLGAFPFDIDSPTFKQVSFSWGFADTTLMLFQCLTQADREAVWAARPLLNNYPFEFGIWYSIWNITGDFYTNPIHLSTFFQEMTVPQKSDCCCIGIGTFAPKGDVPITIVKSYGAFNEPEFNTVDFNSADYENSSYVGTEINFDFIIGKAYQFSSFFDIEIYNIDTNETVGIYRWSGSYWEVIRNFPLASVNLNPAYVLWTDDLHLSGKIDYVGPMPTGSFYSWGVRVCPNKVGDNLEMTIGSELTDDFGSAIVHNGMLGLQPAGDYLGVPIGSLVDNNHNQGGQRMAAYDGVYMRNGVFLPTFTMIVTVPNSQEFIWDGPGEYDNPQWRYDSAGVSADRLAYHHFPKKIVMEMLPPI